jgi:hypothetical protein
LGYARELAHSKKIKQEDLPKFNINKKGFDTGYKGTITAALGLLKKLKTGKYKPEEHLDSTAFGGYKRNKDGDEIHRLVIYIDRLVDEAAQQYKEQIKSAPLNKIDEQKIGKEFCRMARILYNVERSVKDKYPELLRALTDGGHESEFSLFGRFLYHKYMDTKTLVAVKKHEADRAKVA